MGEIFLAQDTLRGGVEVALKMLHESQVTFIDEFKREFALLSQLSHPNIAQVFDFGAAEQAGHLHYFYTQEFIGGEDLLQATNDGDFEAIREYLVQICRALDFIHARNVLHLDIKPQNILIAHAGVERVARLVDFGIAAEFSERRLRLQKFVGSLAFMAPEVLTGQPLDGRADLYALGVTLYFVLTRTLPFYSEKMTELVRQHLSMTPPTPRERNPKVPEAMSVITMRLMAKEPERRYFDAVDVISHLNQLTGQTYPAVTADTKRGLLRSARLTGRDAEMARFRELLLNLSEQKAPAVLVVRGGDGTGKSRLARAFKAEAQLHGADTVLGEAVANTNRPYQPFVPLFARLLRRGQAASAEFGASDLYEIAPELFQQPPLQASELPAEEAIVRALESFRQLFETRLVRPTVVFLEDLHWAGVPSWRLFEYWASALLEQNQPPVLLCVTIDPSLCHDEAIATLERLERKDGISVLELRALDDGEVKTFAESVLGPTGLADAFWGGLRKLSAGNPRLVGGIISDLVDAGVLVFSGTQWELDAEAYERFRLPTSLVELARKQLNGLDQEQRQLLLKLAIFSTPVSARLLGRVLNRRESVAVLTLLVPRGYVQKVIIGGEGVYAVAHETLREVALSDLDPTTKRALHLWAASVLSSHVSPENPLIEQLAQHYFGAGRYAEARSYLERSAQRALRAHDYRQTRTLFQQLRDTLTALDVDGTLTEARWACLGSLEHVLDVLGDRRAQAECIDALIFLAGEREPLRRLAQQRLAMLHFLNAEYQTGLKICSQMLGSLDPQSQPVEVAEILRIKAMMYWRLGNYDQAQQLCDRALGMTHGRRDAQTLELAVKLFSLQAGIALQGRNEYGRALRQFQLALRLLGGTGETPTEIKLQGNIGVVQAMCGRYTEALNSLTETVEKARRFGVLRSLIYYGAALGEIYRLLGDYPAARETLKDVLSRAVRSGYRTMESDAHINLAHVYLAVGDFVRAEDHISRATVIAQASGERRNLLRAYAAKTVYLLQRGDLAAARDVIDQRAALADALGDMLGRLLAEKDRALALARVGDGAGALAAAETMMALFRAAPQKASRNRQELYFVHYLALRCVGEELQAKQQLKAALAELEQEFEQIEDPILRHTFVAEVGINRELVENCRAEFGQLPTPFLGISFPERSPIGDGPLPLTTSHVESSMEFRLETLPEGGQRESSVARTADLAASGEREK